MPDGIDFDWKNPNYESIWKQRVERIERIRKNPACLAELKAYYRLHPINFIRDWGITFDPRNVDLGSEATMPFVLFQRQVEWLEWVLRHWHGRHGGLTEKSRDMGMSWLAMALACTLCLHHDGMVVGFGSMDADAVDLAGEPKCLFFKGRMFMANLPSELRGGWIAGRHAPKNRILFPQTGSVVSGDVGENIGRSGRTGIFFLDEAAHVRHPKKIDAALSQTTNCRIDISSANGPANPFATKRFKLYGTDDLFTYHWRDDPRKGKEWYEGEKARLDPVTLAQEVDINYMASLEGALIPSEWVQAAVDAHIELKFDKSGDQYGALDVADQGRDLNAFCGAHGSVIECLEEWTGKGSDIYGTAVRAFDFCDQLGYGKFRYDQNGVGAGIRGDARRINEQRKRDGRAVLEIEEFGSEIIDPGREDIEKKKNRDAFANRKAQAWWSLRTRFQKTYRCIQKDATYSADELISIPNDLKHRMKLCMELAQPTYTLNTAGKILIDKAPEGMPSPNLADAVMMRFARGHRVMKIGDEVLQRMALPGGYGSSRFVRPGVR